MHWWHGGSWWGWTLMSVAMIAFWALLIWGIVWLIRSTSTPSTTPSPTKQSAEAVLAKRFAAGDIDEPEYRSRLEALRTPGSRSA